MDKKKRRIIFSVLLSIVCLELVVFYFLTPNDLEKDIENSETIELTTDSSNHTALVEKEWTATINEQELRKEIANKEEQLQALKNENERTTNQKATTYQFLHSFGKRWLNYDSIYARNQSVREFLTEEAIEMYAIDFDPKVAFESTGEMTHIAHSLSDEHTYVLVGEESARGSWNKIIVEIELTGEENPKITKMVVNYMRQDD